MKAGLFIGAQGACIVGIGIGYQTRRSSRQQAVGKGADERGAMAAIKQVRLADELIDAAVAARLRAEAVGPGGKVVALQIGKWPAFTCDDELIHRRMRKVAADQLELLVRVAPPRRDVRHRQPALDQRQVVGSHGAKLIHSSYWPRDQAFNVSMVTLRLV